MQDLATDTLQVLCELDIESLFSHKCLFPAKIESAGSSVRGLRNFWSIVYSWAFAEHQTTEFAFREFAMGPQFTLLSVINVNRKGINRH